MARNSLAGTKTGNSKSAVHYQSNGESKAKKLAYDKAYQKKNKKKLSIYKSALAKANRENPNSEPGDGKDMAHTNKGLRLKSQKANRGSNGDSAGDKRARGKKKYPTPAWQRKEGKNPKGGLNAKGRASAKKQGMNLKAPVKSGDNPRRASFLSRMGNMQGEEYKDGKPTRLLLSLKAWGASSKSDARKKGAAISKRNKSKKKS